jgi:hypothetical protein
MSHYSVIVCTTNPADIEAKLAPFDENVPECKDGVDGKDCAENCTDCHNPQAKWDWWVVGGRWGGYFAYRSEHAKSVIMPERRFSSPEFKPLHCDGGPKFALDFDVMRAEKMDQARKTYAEWEALVAGTPEALPWSVFAENISENGYTVERAREEYRSQPRIKALEGTDFRWYDDDPVTTFQVPEERYVEHARAQAVPGWGILTLDGRWIEQGSMGWWGMNDATESSKIGYWEASNAYLESLDDDTYLVCVDCHILQA